MPRQEVEPMAPQDVEAEKAVLGSLLIDPEAINRVAPVLRAQDFYRVAHGMIYQACLDLSDRFDAINEISLGHELEARGQFKEVGGVAYTSQLIAQCPPTTFAADYAEIVKKCAFQRDLFKAAGTIAKIAAEGGEPPHMLGRAQEELMKLSAAVGSKGPRRIKEVILAHRAEIDRWMADPTALTGVPTGIVSLDFSTGGLEAGRFYVLAARTSMGKSQVALSIGVNVAHKGTGVVIFTLEMSELSIAMRAILAKARLNRFALRSGEVMVGGVSADWRTRFNAAEEWVGKLPLYIDESPDVSTLDVRARTAQLKAIDPTLGLIVFDYGELAGDKEGSNEQERVSAITRRLQSTARALRMPVLAVYQLSRQTEMRADKVPQLSDLRMSGMIEQAADAVFLLYRPAYYQEQKGEVVTDAERTLLQLIIAKQRDGRTGRFDIFFDPRTGVVGDKQEGR